MGPGVLACANEDHGEVIIEHILRGFWDRSGLVERVGHNTGQGCRVQVRSGKENYLYMFFLIELKRHIC